MKATGPLSSLKNVGCPPEGGCIKAGGRVKKLAPDYRIDHSTGCWEWLKGIGKNGYPHGRPYRLYWCAANGVDAVPDGHHIHHRCRNPRCVNPEHLEAVDKRQHFQLHYLHEKTGLDFEDIQEVHRLGRIVGVRAGAVAYSYGLSETTVYKWWSNTYGPWQAEVPRADRPLPLRTCEFCGEQFQERNRHARFCDPVCQKRAWRERNRERYNANHRAWHARKREAERKAA